MSDLVWATMKGMKSNAIVDTDSDASTSSSVDDSSSLGEKLKQSMKRLNLDDSDDDTSDDSNSEEEDHSEEEEDDDDKTVDMSLQGTPVKTAENKAAGEITLEDQKKPSNGCDDSSQQNEKKVAKKAATATLIKAKYNILDDSSSSSDDDSMDEFLQKSWRRTPQKHHTKNGSVFGSKSGVGKDRDIGGSPDPRRFRLSTNKQVDHSDSEDDGDSVAQEDAFENGWAYNKTRREYSLRQDEEDSTMPPFCLPSKLYKMLYSFQRDGVKWMAGLHVNRVGGTMSQIIFLLSCLFHSNSFLIHP